MISAVSLVVLLVMVESASIKYMVLASPADVNIYNQIPGLDTIRVDCMKMGPGKAHHIFTPQTLVYGGGDSSPTTGATPNTTATSPGDLRPKEFVCGWTPTLKRAPPKIPDLARTACGMSPPRASTA
jgi:hypothetical protein